MKGFNHRRTLFYGWKPHYTKKEWAALKKRRKVAKRSRKLNRRAK